MLLEEKLFWLARGYRIIRFVEITCIRHGTFRTAIESELESYPCAVCQCACCAVILGEGVTSMGGKGSGGHNRKPTAQKLAEGNRGKRRLNLREPKALPGEPEMPSGMTKQATRRLAGSGSDAQGQ